MNNTMRAVVVMMTSADASNLPELDTLAEEFGINIALESRTNPKALVAALNGRSKRIGIAADLCGWLQSGVKPVDGLPVVKDRLLVVRAADRSALGSGSAEWATSFSPHSRPA
jgi:hypothetical protein